MRTSEAAKISLNAPPCCEELCRMHYARVAQLCRLLLVDRHEAEEVAQEVFLKLVKECRAQSQVLSWEAWLTRVTINACRDRRRSAWWKWWRNKSSAANSRNGYGTSSVRSPRASARSSSYGVWRAYPAKRPRRCSG